MHVEGTPIEIREHDGRDHRVVPDEIALGQRLLLFGARGKQHFVEIGEPQRHAVELPLPRVAERIERGNVGPR